MIQEKILAYQKSFQAMSSRQLNCVVHELTALAPRYLSAKPAVAEICYVGAGIAIAELLRRDDGLIDMTQLHSPIAAN